MNTKRIFFWLAFIIVLVLIILGLIAAQNKSPSGGPGSPAPVTAADHVRGPATAPVTMIEYGDFQCPACGQYYPIVERLYDESSSSLRMVFRHFPLPQHLNAPLAAQASEAAAIQGKFWEMYNQLYTTQAQWSDIADPHSVFIGYATKLGLDPVKFKSDIDASSTQAIVNADQTEGQQIGINATPTFFLNGKAIVNPQSYDEFKADIQKAAQSAK